MPDAAQTGLLPAREVLRTTPLATAANGLRYASFGYTEVPADSLQHIVEAVPPLLAAALSARAYYFVPLAISEREDGPRPEAALEISRGYTADLGDRATCHRNLVDDGVECTFISARLMQDRFALAFEFFINVGHQRVDVGEVPRAFAELVWAQARADVRGETSQDAWESRTRALELVAGESATQRGELTGGSRPSQRGEGSKLLSLFASRDSQAAPAPRPGLNNPRAESGHGESGSSTSLRLALPGPESQAGSAEQSAYFEAAFADTLAIYMLSLAMDLDYADLREREYPLLAAPALADRLRLAAELFPPAPGYEFSIRYRRRH